MSVMRGWTICDRCGFKYRRFQVRKEATNWVVCESCYDGKYDLVRHPQNKPPRMRREMLPIPDGRPMDEPPIYAAGLESGGFLLTEAGEVLEITSQSWDIRQTIYLVR
jgi:hypothetical protein